MLTYLFIHFRVMYGVESTRGKKGLVMILPTWEKTLLLIHTCCLPVYTDLLYLAIILLILLYIDFESWLEQMSTDQVFNLLIQETNLVKLMIHRCSSTRDDSHQVCVRKQKQWERMFWHLLLIFAVWRVCFSFT